MLVRTWQTHLLPWFPSKNKIQAALFIPGQTQASASSESLQMDSDIYIYIYIYLLHV